MAEIAPILRGAVAIAHDELAGTVKRQILCFRTCRAILNYVNGAELARYTQVGVVTPDHTIRTKNWPLVVPAPEAGKLDEWKNAVTHAVDEFVARYHDYFARNNARSAQKKKELDPLPRVVLVPGVGLFGLGASAKDAAIAADIAENTVEVITDAEAIGEYRCIAEFDMFEVEYWSLEQAKLGKAAEKPLARQVASSPAAARASARPRRKRWRRKARRSRCSTAITEAAQSAAKQIGKNALAIAMRRDRCRRGARGLRCGGGAFGGVDIVVSNAGAAWQGTIGEVDDETLAQELRAQFLRPSERWRRTRCA